jgi:hypothetical protein
VITTDRYRGPRAFKGDAAAIARDLQQMPRELDRAFEQQAHGLARRWKLSELFVSVAGATVNLATEFDSLLRVNCGPGGTVNALLPALDSQRIGSELGVLRTSTAGTIVMRPPAGVLVNGATTVTLAATVGYFTFVFDGAGYYQRA